MQRYIWDEVNRLKSLCGTSEGARYEYRADGMRVKKITGLTIEWVGDEYSASGYYDENLNQDLPTVRYFYDGQMPMEEDSTYKENSVSVRDYTQYGLGARGIDYIRNVHHSSGEAVVFPIYDGHGNMVYTLSRAANETFSLGNKRIYGVWGDLRYDGNPNAGPNTQYCANLGHKKDNESGLTYMRARYYEPWTGRFISEDRNRDGINWYSYCGNNPIKYADETGTTREDVERLKLLCLLLLMTGSLLLGLYEIFDWLAARVGNETMWSWQEFMARNGWEDTGIEERKRIFRDAKTKSGWYKAGRACRAGGIALTALSGYFALLYYEIYMMDLYSEGVTYLWWEDAWMQR